MRFPRHDTSATSRSIHCRRWPGFRSGLSQDLSSVLQPPSEGGLPRGYPPATEGIRRTALRTGAPTWNVFGRIVPDCATSSNFPSGPKCGRRRDSVYPTPVLFARHTLSCSIDTRIPGPSEVTPTTSSFRTTFLRARTPSSKVARLHPVFIERSRLLRVIALTNQIAPPRQTNCSP